MQMGKLLPYGGACSRQTSSAALMTCRPNN
jgi:hypothetical protein